MKSVDESNLKCPYCGVVARSYEDKVQHIEDNHLFRLKD